jgi:hypothetical protein
MSSEFERIVVVYTLNKFHYKAETNFERVKASCKTAVAALVAGAPQTSVSATEQAQIAALPASQTDGVLAKLIITILIKQQQELRSIKVAGTAITNANIKGVRQSLRSSSSSSLKWFRTINLCATFSQTNDCTS